eukprot:2121305-Rhodomonas_salina.3
MSGTEIAYVSMVAYGSMMSGTKSAYGSMDDIAERVAAGVMPGILLHASYAMSGTDIPYGLRSLLRY